MKIQWFIKEENYIEYKKHQQDYDYSDYGEYIGSVRAGNLCFDIINWGNHLWFDLYVGGVDSGYGYSSKKEYKNYPYDYADSCSFMWDKDVDNMELDEFKKILSQHIEKHLYSEKNYISFLKGITVDLIAKANEPLQLW